MRIARLATISRLHDELVGAWRDFFLLASPGHCRSFSVLFVAQVPFGCFHLLMHRRGSNLD